MVGTLGPDDLKTLTEGLQNISAAMTRKQAESEFIKTVKSDLKDKLNISKKILTKLANAVHQQNLDEENADNKEVNELYNLVSGSTTSDD